MEHPPEMTLRLTTYKGAHKPDTSEELFEQNLSTNPMTFPYLVFIFTAVYFSFKPYYMFLLFFGLETKTEKCIFFPGKQSSIFPVPCLVFDGFQ